MAALLTVESDAQGVILTHERALVRGAGRTSVFSYEKVYNTK